MTDRRLNVGILLGVFFLVGGVISFMLRPVPVKAPEGDPVHFHAGFQIYVDDVLQDFSTMEYMELAPCDVGPGKEEAEEDETLDLHNGVGDVVHVHHAGMTWNDLLMYLQEHQQFAPENLSVKGVIGYVNGEEDMNIRDRPINAYDSAVIIIGYALGDIKEKIATSVKLPQIQEAEVQKENCGI